MSEQDVKTLLSAILNELKEINEYIEFKKHEELSKVAAYQELLTPTISFKGNVNSLKSKEQMKRT